MKIKGLTLYAMAFMISFNSYSAKAVTDSGCIKLKDAVLEKNYGASDILIEQDDLEYLKKANLKKFNSLSSIKIENVYLKNGKELDLSKQINYISIYNSVVNLSSIDLKDYKSVRLNDVYSIGKKVKKSLLKNSLPLNEEYKPYSKYDKRLAKIAKRIKKSSNGSKKDLIKKATLYVLDNLSYDYDGDYASLPMMEAILDRKSGVCSHYAALESQLLNRLGIPTISLSGFVVPDDPNTGHGWVISYVNGKWYSIDPTWLDNKESISNLKKNKKDMYYMAPIDNKDFNEFHHSFFTKQNKIPKKYIKARY